MDRISPKTSQSGDQRLLACSVEETELKGLKATTSEGINLGRYPLEALHE
jgi:hypothetical protein